MIPFIYKQPIQTYKLLNELKLKSTMGIVASTIPSTIQVLLKFKKWSELFLKISLFIVLNTIRFPTHDCMRFGLSWFLLAGSWPQHDTHGAPLIQLSILHPGYHHATCQTGLFKLRDGMVRDVGTSERYVSDVSAKVFQTELCLRT